MGTPAANRRYYARMKKDRARLKKHREACRAIMRKKLAELAERYFRFNHNTKTRKESHAAGKHGLHTVAKAHLKSPIYTVVDAHGLRRIEKWETAEELERRMLAAAKECHR